MLAFTLYTGGSNDLTQRVDIDPVEVVSVVETERRDDRRALQPVAVIRLRSGVEYVAGKIEKVKGGAQCLT